MKTWLSTKENVFDVAQVKVENDGLQTPSKRNAARESIIRSEFLLQPGGFLDSQTGDTQFFGSSQRKNPYYFSPTKYTEHELGSQGRPDSRPRKKTRFDLDVKEEPTAAIPASLVKTGRKRDRSSEDTSALSKPINMRVRMERERNTGEVANERETEKVMESIRKANQKMSSLEDEAKHARGEANELELMADRYRKELSEVEKKAKLARDKITAVEKAMRSVRDDIVTHEEKLGFFILSRFKWRIMPTFGSFPDLEQIGDTLSIESQQQNEDPYAPSVETQIYQAVIAGYSPAKRTHDIIN